MSDNRMAKNGRMPEYPDKRIFWRCRIFVSRESEFWKMSSVDTSQQYNSIKPNTLQACRWIWVFDLLQFPSGAILFYSSDSIQQFIVDTLFSAVRQEIHRWCCSIDGIDHTGHPSTPHHAIRLFVHFLSQQTSLRVWTVTWNMPQTWGKMLFQRRHASKSLPKRWAR